MGHTPYSVPLPPQLSFLLYLLYHFSTVKSMPMYLYRNSSRCPWKLGHTFFCSPTYELHYLLLVTLCSSHTGPLHCFSHTQCVFPSPCWYISIYLKCLPMPQKLFNLFFVFAVLKSMFINVKFRLSYLKSFGGGTRGRNQ